MLWLLYLSANIAAIFSCAGFAIQLEAELGVNKVDQAGTTESTQGVMICAYLDSTPDGCFGEDFGFDLADLHQYFGAR